MPTQICNQKTMCITDLIETNPPPAPTTSDWNLYKQWDDSFFRGQPSYDLRLQNPIIHKAVQKVYAYTQYTKKLAFLMDTL